MDSPTFVTIVTPQGERVEVDLDYLPENSLWAALALDKEEEIVIPASVPVPARADGKKGSLMMPLSEKIVSKLFDFLDVLKGGNLPVVGVDDNMKLGTRVLMVGAEKPVLRSLGSRTDASLFLTPEQHAIVSDLSISELIDLSLAAIYFGFDELNEMALAKLVTVKNVDGNEALVMDEIQRLPQ